MRLLFLFRIFLFFVITAAIAEPEQFFADWTRVDLTGPIGPKVSDLRYLAGIENRNQQLRSDVGIGYGITPLISAWGGYTQIIPNEGSPLPYRPWQQVIWELFDKNPLILLQVRSRIEEFKQEGQPEWVSALAETRSRRVAE